MVCPLGVLETPEVDDEISKTFMRIFSDLKKGDGLIPFKEPKALFEKEYSTDLNKEIKAHILAFRDEDSILGME